MPQRSGVGCERLHGDRCISVLLYLLNVQGREGERERERQRGGDDIPGKGRAREGPTRGDAACLQFVKRFPCLLSITVTCDIYS